MAFDILAGIGYGYIFSFYLRNYIQFSDAFIQKCENKFGNDPIKKYRQVRFND
jgi:hypothetical protein